jgi:hypothetical protein
MVGAVFSTLKQYFLPIYAPLMIVALAALIPFGALAAVAYGPVHSLATSVDNDHHFTPSTGQGIQLLVLGGVGLLLALLWTLLVFVVGSTVCTTVLKYAVLGRKLTVRQGWSLSRPHFLRVAGESLLLGLAAAGGLALVGLVATAVGLATDSFAATFSLAFLLMATVWGFLLYAQVRLVLAVPVVVLEHSGPIEALRRAWKLNRGAWWRSLGIPYLINLIGSFGAQLVLLPILVVGAFPLIAWTSAHPVENGAHGAVGPIIAFCVYACLGAAFVNVLVLPLTPLANGLLYMDRRIRLEQLDLALAAEAGMSLHRPQVLYGVPRQPDPGP